MRRYARLPMNGSKMHNKPCWYNGIRFDSHKERDYYVAVLLPLYQAKRITGLQLQVPFPLMVGRTRVGTYKADFTYFDEHGMYHVLDVKGAPLTDVYKLKKKILAANGITIEEV